MPASSTFTIIRTFASRLKSHTCSNLRPVNLSLSKPELEPHWVSWQWHRKITDNDKLMVNDSECQWAESKHLGWHPFWPDRPPVNASTLSSCAFTPPFKVMSLANRISQWRDCCPPLAATCIIASSLYIELKGDAFFPNTSSDKRSMFRSGVLASIPSQRRMARSTYDLLSFSPAVTTRFWLNLWYSSSDFNGFPELEDSWSCLNCPSWYNRWILVDANKDYFN